jgi:hypothetical protein
MTLASYQSIQLTHLSQENLVPVPSRAPTERIRLISGYQILLANRNKVTYSGGGNTDGRVCGPIVDQYLVIGAQDLFAATAWYRSTGIHHVMYPALSSLTGFTRLYRLEDGVG